MRRFKYIVLLSVIFVGFQNCSPYHATDTNQTTSLSLSADQTLQKSSLSILSARCAVCHDQVSMGGVTNILDVMHLINSGLVTPGDSSKGRLILSIQENKMPQGSMMAAGELQTLKDWVASMQLK